MAKKFSKLIYIYESDGVPQYATTALITLRKDLMKKGFEMPAASTIRLHLANKGKFVSGSVGIYELGLFKTLYEASQIDNIKKVNDGRIEK